MSSSFSSSTFSSSSFSSSTFSSIIPQPRTAGLPSHSHVTAAIKIQPPFANECVLKGVSTCKDGEGINVEIFMAVMNVLGFNYTIVRVADGETGWKEKDGKWKGLLGQLQRHEVDMSAYCRNRKISAFLPHLKFLLRAWKCPVRSFHVSRVHMDPRMELRMDQTPNKNFTLAKKIEVKFWLKNKLEICCRFIINRQQISR